MPRGDGRLTHDLNPDENGPQDACGIFGIWAPGEEVVNLTYFHHMGYREIAEIMDCPNDTVKTRMFHARRHLKRILAGELADWI